MMTTNLLPLPDLEHGDQRAFKKKSLNDATHDRKRPPKLNQKQNDSIYNRAVNRSIPHAISFRQSTSTANCSALNESLSLSSSVYRPTLRESYFEQCFEVVDRIGEGSFGEVFKVRSKEDGQLYAIKKSLKLYRGETSRQEKIEEVKRYEQFSDHDNCITLHKAWEQNDLLYMQLELCKCNLETYVLQTNGALPEIEVVNILIDLLNALKALHDQNLIHLDIKLENIMISEDNVCKLGDFGLVADLQAPNLRDSSEGDCRYIAPETLERVFTKAADIFSLGITIFELSSKLELPKNGFLWHALRNGNIPVHLISHLSIDLQNIIKSMMSPRPEDRPSVDELLAMPQIQQILKRRRVMKPFISIKKRAQNILNRWHATKEYIISLFLSIFSIFQLKHLKKPNQRPNIALTSTPTAPTIAINPASSEDSFLRLDDSEINFEDSPSNRSGNRSLSKLPDTLIVNSTPLNHYSGHGAFRRSRMEISRTSLVFDDSDCQPVGSGSLMNGTSPLKRKKLFDCSDESD